MAKLRGVGRTARVTAATSIALMLTSCFSIYTVKKFNPEKPGGIPFFTKKLIAEQSTVYSLTWLKVTVEAKPILPAGAPVPATVARAVWLVDEHLWDPAIVSSAASSATDLNDLHSKLQSWFLDVGRINVALQLKPNPAGGVHFDPLLLSVLSNSFKIVAENDYSQTYEVNVDVPIFGSGTAGVKLSTDGSLSEASGGVDTTGLADSIPLKGLLEKHLRLVETFTSQPGVAPKVDFSFVVEPQGYLYALVMKFPAQCADKMPKVGCGDQVLGQSLPLIPFEPNMYWYQRTRIGSGSETSDAGSKNTASFSGSVKLPGS